MKRIVFVIVFAFAGIVFANAQAPSKSTKIASPQPEKEMIEAKAKNDVKEATTTKKDDCSNKDMKHCGSKSKHGCCKDKGEAKKEETK